MAQPLTRCPPRKRPRRGPPCPLAASLTAAAEQHTRRLQPPDPEQPLKGPHCSCRAAFILCVQRVWLCDAEEGGGEKKACTKTRCRQAVGVPVVRAVVKFSALLALRTSTRVGRWSALLCSGRGSE